MTTNVPARPARFLRYDGVIHYCYADACSMFLSAHGIEIPSGTLEVLSGISLLGAHRLSEPECEKLYFSLVPSPDRLTTALRLLGIEVETVNHAVGDDPTQTLREEIEATGPVLVGPADMGGLRYFPYHQHATGADHYVVAFDVDDVDVHVHDPMGYPFASVRRAHFGEGWRAELLRCPGPPYHRWRSPRRATHPSPADVYQAALPYFEQIRRETPCGASVIRAYTEDLRADRLSPRSQSFLTVFLLQTQARRGLDYACFFKEGGDEEAALWKYEQARHFGRAMQAANATDWRAVADHLDGVAVLEEKLSSRPFA